MYEIRLHGRGGQGAVKASGILAAGLVAAGKFAVAIPSFGFERRGAPVGVGILVEALLQTPANRIAAAFNAITDLNAPGPPH